MGTVGVIANPNAGKDIRRLVAHASPTSDAAKIGIIRRALLGAVEGGATSIVLAPDSHSLTARALEDLEIDVPVKMLDERVEGRASDSTRMAERMQDADVGAIIVLGGDGTNRDVIKGWLDATLMPISTGTNNVFPRLIEATLAGIAAGLVACGAVALSVACDRADVIHVDYRDGSPSEMALVDVAVLDARFTGSRAIWDGSLLRAIVCCIAEPATVGLSSLAGVLAPVSRTEIGGVLVRMARPRQVASSAAGGVPTSAPPPLPARTVRAPLAPGMFVDVRWTWVEHVDEGQAIELYGPGVLSFDGERDQILAPDGVAIATIRRDGPYVIDPVRTMAAAAKARRFDRS